MTYLKRPAIGFVHAQAGINQTDLSYISFSEIEDDGIKFNSTNKTTNFDTNILGITRICGDESQASTLRLSQYCASVNETNTQDRKYVFSGRTCDENDTQYLKGDSEAYCKTDSVKIYENYTAVSSRTFSWTEWTHLEYFRISE